MQTRIELTAIQYVNEPILTPKTFRVSFICTDMVILEIDSKCGQGTTNGNNHASVNGIMVKESYNEILTLIYSNAD